MNERSNTPALFLASVREHPQEQMLGSRQSNGWIRLSSEQAHRRVARGRFRPLRPVGGGSGT